MSRIRYEIFGNEAEILEFATDDSDRLELSFTEENEGLLSIEGVVARVVKGKCSFDARLIEPGMHEPILIIKNTVVKLPGIVKSQRRVSPAVCGDDYTRSISLRERRLRKRVELLEKELGALLLRLNTTTIF